MKPKFQPLLLEDFEYAIHTNPAKTIFTTKGRNILQDGKLDYGVFMHNNQIVGGMFDSTKLIPLYNSLSLPEIQPINLDPYTDQVGLSMASKNDSELIRSIKEFSFHIIKSFPIYPCWDLILDNIEFRWKREGESYVELAAISSFLDEVVFDRAEFEKDGLQAILQVVTYLLDILVLNQPTARFCDGFTRRLYFIRDLCGAAPKDSA